MKPVIAILGVTALLSLPAQAGATSNLESTAKAYMDSLLSHDKSAMKAAVRPGSQAESSWDNRSSNIARLQADKASNPVGYRNRGCVERTSKTVCDYVITTGTGDSWALALHVLKSNGKVEDALRGR